MPLVDPALRYFLAVYETGSVNAAARTLYVAGSAVSRHLARLEKDAGATLFERIPTGVEPTDAGHAFARYARRAVQEAADVLDEMHASRTADTVIHIAAPNGIGHEFLPRVAADYRGIHTGTRFVLHIVAPAEATRMVRGGQADVAVTFNIEPERGITVVHAVPSPLHAAMRAGHELSDRASVSVHDLLSYPLALSTPDTTNRHLIDVTTAAAGAPLKPVLVCDDPNAMICFLERSDAVTLFGRVTIGRAVALGRIVAVPMRDKALGGRSLQVQLRAGRRLTAAVQGFVDAVVAELDRSDV